MKNIIKASVLILILVSLTLSLCACLTADPIVTPEVTTESTETDAPPADSDPSDSESSGDATVDEEKNGAIFFEALYESVINEHYEFIRYERYEEESGDGMMYIPEVITANSWTSDEALEALGYSIYDINADGISELIIGEFHSTTQQLHGATVYALYTLVDNEPVLVTEGWYRNSFALKKDNVLVNFASSSAYSSATALYSLPAGKAELECDMICFTDTDETKESVNIYYNPNGVYDISDPDTVIISDDKYDEIMGEIMQMPGLYPNFISFYRYDAYKNTEYTVEIRDASIRFNYYPEYHTVLSYDSEFASTVVFSTRENVTDFVIFECTAEYDDNGISYTEGETLYSDESFETNEAVELTYYSGEFMPTAGIRYTDTDGSAVTLYFSANGMDGAYSLSES